MSTDEEKFKLLDEIIFPACDKMGSTIVFVRTREIAKNLHEKVRWLADWT